MSEFGPRPELHEQQSALFEPSDSLDAILASLYRMKQEGKELRGSSTAYSPVELAERVMQAADAFYKVAKGLHVPDLEQLERMPEINAITRAGGLREAVSKTLQKIALTGSNRATSRTFDLYEAVTGTGKFGPQTSPAPSQETLPTGHSGQTVEAAKPVGHVHQEGPTPEVRQRTLDSLAHELGITLSTPDGMNRVRAELIQLVQLIDAEQTR